jgi:hypothetical protein
MRSYTLSRDAGRAVLSEMRLEAEGGASGRFGDVRGFFFGKILENAIIYYI